VLEKAEAEHSERRAGDGGEGRYGNNGCNDVKLLLELSGRLFVFSHFWPQRSRGIEKARQGR
jgi:hypothetical protein